MSFIVDISLSFTEYHLDLVCVALLSQKLELGVDFFLSVVCIYCFTLILKSLYISEMMLAYIFIARERLKQVGMEVCFQAITYDRTLFLKQKETHTKTTPIVTYPSCTINKKYLKNKNTKQKNPTHITKNMFIHFHAL
jgi:predicted RNase H-like nuclease